MRNRIISSLLVMSMLGVMFITSGNQKVIVNTKTQEQSYSDTIKQEDAIIENEEISVIVVDNPINIVSAPYEEYAEQLGDITGLTQVKDLEQSEETVYSEKDVEEQSENSEETVIMVVNEKTNIVTNTNDKSTIIREVEKGQEIKITNIVEGDYTKVYSETQDEWIATSVLITKEDYNKQQKKEEQQDKKEEQQDKKEEQQDKKEEQQEKDKKADDNKQKENVKAQDKKQENNKKAKVKSTVDQSEALLEIAEPDNKYKGKIVELSKSDRDLLERVVFGEAGNNYKNAAIVAQTFRDYIVYKGYTSIKDIVKDCKYSGRTNRGTTKNVKNACKFIFDEGGIAVKHKVFCFYSPKHCKSSWHEKQHFVIEYGGHRYFSF